MAKNKLKGLDAWLPSVKSKENRTNLEQIFDAHNADKFWGITREWGSVWSDPLNNSIGAIIKYTGNLPSYVKKP
jgi:hypothetical protein